MILTFTSTDPADWSCEHIGNILTCVSNQFDLPPIDAALLPVSGAQLVALSRWDSVPLWEFVQSHSFVSQRRFLWPSRPGCRSEALSISRLLKPKQSRGPEPKVRRWSCAKSFLWMELTQSPIRSLEVETTSTTTTTSPGPSSPWTRPSSPWTRERRKRPSSSSTCSSTSLSNFSQPPSLSSLKTEQISCKYNMSFSFLAYPIDANCIFWQIAFFFLVLLTLVSKSEQTSKQYWTNRGQTISFRHQFHQFEQFLCISVNEQLGEEWLS